MDSDNSETMLHPNNTKKAVSVTTLQNTTNRIIVFPEFKEVDGNFSWEYDETTNYYCLSSDSKSYAKFDNNECGEFIEFKMDKKWCDLYTNSTLVYEDNAELLCK